ncbi:MAG TPA: HEAT repeat domain-containing protein [Gemmatimonadales bacterium]|nr:HEAT repeat domain-containing protein [Gemmatimonadales bacterium]
MTAFTKAFERLLVLLHDAPGDEAGHAAAAVAAAEAVARKPARIDAGVEGSQISVRMTLRARLRARAADWIEADAGATPDDLRTMARALLSENEPLPTEGTVRAVLVPLPVAVEAPHDFTPPPAALRVTDDPDRDPELERLAAAARDAVARRAWGEVLTAGEGLLAHAESAPEARRVRIIAARRALPRRVLEELFEHAIRHPEDQSRVGSLLSRIGPDGHEVMVDGVATSESLAARRFLHEALAATPEAFPLLVPLLQRPAPHQARHGASLLGRLGNPRAIQPLAEALEHDDAGVRGEAARALARFHDPAARAALTAALGHPSPATRIDVASAIGNSGQAMMSPAVMAAFGTEQESGVRRALATAAARLGSPQAVEELVQIAVERRTLLNRNAPPVEVRLDAVAGLAAANTAQTRRSLDRIVREADRPVREAADRALNVRRAGERQ